jgi:hypothetical protein
MAAARDLQRQPAPSQRRRTWRPSWRWLAVFAAVDLVVGSVMWRLVSSHQDSPVKAVTRVADLAGRGDWAGVYDHLCSADRKQFRASDVAAGGGVALQMVHGLAGVRITGTRTVGVHLLGPLSLPAQQVSGQLAPRFGPTFDFHVTTVREVTGWRLCLSVGGYGSSAFGVDVPLGS